MDNNPSITQLEQIFMACDDNAGHHILWISRDGNVHLDRLPDELGPIEFEDSKPNMQCRFETYSQGAGYVGSDAAKDHKFINTVFNDLVTVWPKVKGQNEVEYIDY
jgi:hypothetical protein